MRWFPLAWHHYVKRRAALTAREHAVGMMSKLLKQCRKPSGLLGEIIVRGMNRRHARVTDWGLGHVSIGRHDTIPDVGCGGGETVRKLAEPAQEGQVYDIDLSEVSVSASRRRNRQFIRAGRVDIRYGAVSCLPYPDGQFDLVTAVETHYFWPDLVSDMREILRVLKPGGKLLIIGEAYKGGKYDERNRRWVQWCGLAYHGIKELGGVLSAAGYAGVQVFEEYERGWLCGLGKKP